MFRRRHDGRFFWTGLSRAAEHRGDFALTQCVLNRAFTVRRLVLVVGSGLKQGASGRLCRLLLERQRNLQSRDTVEFFLRFATEQTDQLLQRNRLFRRVNHRFDL